MNRYATPIPIGLEKVLYTAATDAAFREALLADREGAVAAAGLQLRPSELAMLRSLSRPQLQANIAGVDPSPGNVSRRTLLRAVATTAATVASTEAFVGCTGALPDNPADLYPPPDQQATDAVPDAVSCVWERELSTGAALTAVWGRSGTEVYAVGGGLVLSRVPTGWRGERVLPDGQLTGLCGTASSLFAVGNRARQCVVLRNDGQSWSELALGEHRQRQLSAVWCAPDGQVFAVGHVPGDRHAGAILHHDGTRWRTEGAQHDVRLHGVWGLGANLVYAVGEERSPKPGGCVLRFDGAAWKRIARTPAPLRAVYASPAHGMVAVGGNQVLIFRNGEWSRPSLDSPVELRGVWLGAPHEAYLAGAVATSADPRPVVFALHQGGWYEQPIAGRGRLEAVWGSRADVAFAVGGLGKRGMIVSGCRYP